MISHESPIKIAEKVPLLSFEEARVNTALGYVMQSPLQCCLNIIKMFQFFIG